MAKKTKQEIDALNEETVKRFKQLNEYSFITKKGELLLDEEDDQPVDGVELEEPEVEVPDGEFSELLVGRNEPTEVPVEVVNEPQPEVGGEIEIDITDLTQKQDKVLTSVESVIGKTTELLDFIKQIEAKIDLNNQHIDSELNDIKKEIEVRNPTPKEVLQKSVTIGNPLNQTPEQYWAAKQAEGKYELSDDDTEKEKEYVLKNSDIDRNMRNVYKTFGLEDDEVNQTLSGLIGN
jgi:hypothetical protein